MLAAIARICKGYTCVRELLACERAGSRLLTIPVEILATVLKYIAGQGDTSVPSPRE
jgi:hypothetical protein